MLYWEYTRNIINMVWKQIFIRWQCIVDIKKRTTTKMYNKNILLKTNFVQWFQNEWVLIHMAQPMTNSSPVGGWSIPSGQTEPGSCFPQGPKNKYICAWWKRFVSLFWGNHFGSPLVCITSWYYLYIFINTDKLS